MTMTDANKRKLSSTEQETSPKRQHTSSSTPPSLVALPPPLMQYSNGQLVSVVQPPYYMYPQQPIYYPVSPQQTDKRPSTPRILPKQADTSPQQLYPQPQTPLSPFYAYPFQQISPTLMPSAFPTSTADEREKARKVSHSAIERRRRERINDKILQLKQLIPSCVEQDNLHKMSILQSAIDYITYLKQVVQKLDDQSDEILKGDHLKVKATRSMLPKEVEPFTNQFSVQKDSEQHSVQRGLKPMDVIRSGTPLVSTRPLTPPQEQHPKLSDTTDARPTEEAGHMSLQNILC
ncbi:hypothetical protein BD560DRAFT_410116 [Blakeslea trispora]|nr:hypothetical protein BD560DRAFT_410116 [Blakeslea trispora]